MPEFQPANPDYKSAAIEHYKIQSAMHYIGAELTDIKPGYVEITLPYSENLAQQNGFIHAGIIATLADGAGGYAAYTLLNESDNVLAVEFKINFLNPAKGDKLIARGKVIKNGRSLIICTVDIFSVENNSETLCALMQQTLAVR